MTRFAVAVRRGWSADLPDPLVLVVELADDDRLDDPHVPPGSRIVDDLDEVRPGAVDALTEDLCATLAHLLDAGDITYRDGASLPLTSDGFAELARVTLDAEHVLDNGTRLILDGDAAALFHRHGIDPTRWEWVTTPEAWRDLTG